MQSNSPQGKKVPLIFIGVAVLVIAAGILVRSRNSSPSAPGPEPAPVSDSEPVSAPAPESIPALAPEPEPMLAEAPEPVQPVRWASLSSTDDNGDNWTLALAGVPSRRPQEGTTPGVPIVVKADVHGYGKSISIGLIIQGQAGEVYQPGAAKNGRRRPSPTFKVFDESGTVVGSGSFEYG